MPDTPAVINKPKPKCFMAMPLSVHPEFMEKYNKDGEHFQHVMSHLFEKAIAAAGMEPIRPESVGSSVIHGDIIKSLVTADLVLVDISTLNPNVYFEFGIRTALDLPVAVVRDSNHDKLPFDTGLIHHHTYCPGLFPWKLDDQIEALRKHILAALANSKEKSLWHYFGITSRAKESVVSESPLEAKVNLLLSEMQILRNKQEMEEYSKMLSPSVPYSVPYIDDNPTTGAVILPDYTTVVLPVEGTIAWNHVMHSIVMFNGISWVETPTSNTFQS